MKTKPLSKRYLSGHDSFQHTEADGTSMHVTEKQLFQRGNLTAISVVKACSCGTGADDTSTYDTEKRNL